MSKLNLSQRVPRTYDPQTIVELFRQVEAQLNGLTEGSAGVYHGAATAAPSSGTWVRGDWVKNSEPSATGWFGWVCVTSGSPGTWKGFGEIEA